jgi:hypothetical protein
MKEEIAALGLALGKALLPFIATLIGILIGHCIAWIQARIKSVKIQGIEFRLGRLAQTVVEEIEQVVISKLPDKPTVQDYLHAKEAALASLRIHLGPKGIEEIKQVMGWDDTSLDMVLSSYIESHVHFMKPNNGAAVQLLPVENVAVPAGGVA